MGQELSEAQKAGDQGVFSYDKVWNWLTDTQANLYGKLLLMPKIDWLVISRRANKGLSLTNRVMGSSHLGPHENLLKLVGGELPQYRVSGHRAGIHCPSGCGDEGRELYHMSIPMALISQLASVGKCGSHDGVSVKRCVSVCLGCYQKCRKLSGL